MYFIADFMIVNGKEMRLIVDEMFIKIYKVGGVLNHQEPCYIVYSIVIILL